MYDGRKNGQSTNIEQLDKPRLNAVLGLYFPQVMKIDGKHYEPSSLANMQAGIDRYLKENGCSYSIIKDVEFPCCQDRAKYLRDDLGTQRIGCVLMCHKNKKFIKMTYSTVEHAWFTGLKFW